MPVVAAHLTLKPSDLTRVGESAFQTYHEARVTYALENIEDFDAFFGAVKMNLRPGDKVTICSFSNKEYKNLMEIREMRITAGGQLEPKVKLEGVWTSELFNVPTSKAQKKQFESQQKKLYPRKEFGGGFVVMDEKENVIERFKTKKEATDYIDRLNTGYMDSVMQLTESHMET